MQQGMKDAPLDRAHRGAVLGCQVTETSFALPVSLCDGFSGLQGQVVRGGQNLGQVKGNPRGIRIMPRAVLALGELAEL